MKRLVIVLAQFIAFSATNAGEFINLGLNDPNLAGLVKLSDGRAFGEPSNLLPGWTLKAEAPYEIDPVWYDERRVGGYTGFGITLAKSAPGQVAAFGKFGLGVSNAQIVNGREVSVAISVSQSGRVPETAETLRFFNESIVAQPLVLVNGLETEQRTFDPTNPVNYWEVDVRKYAGQDATIEFVFPGRRGGIGTAFDVLGFSMIPEPDVRSFMALGVSLFLFTRFAKRVFTSWSADSTER